LTPLQALRFLIPPSEPDMRVSTHPALHEPIRWAMRLFLMTLWARAWEYARPGSGSG
jgi:hypothetical protein